MIQETQIEAPVNPFASKIIGAKGESVYWAPKGFKYPVCEDIDDNALIKTLFNKAILNWADLVGCTERELLEEALRSGIWTEPLKEDAAFPDEAIPFVSISSIPLNEEYFTDYYSICYFTSDPYKLNDNTYITVGVIGQ